MLKDMTREISIIKNIEKNFIWLRQNVKNIRPGNLDKKWKDLINKEPGRFINSDQAIKNDRLKNFRRLLIFIPDEPTFNPAIYNPKNLLGGGRRGSKRLLLDCLDVIKKHNYEELLEKYPCSEVGNPYVFKYRGYRFTYRWTKHIYSLGLFKQVLGGKIKEDFTTLDIGSSYGIFSYLLKHEFKKCHCVLLDFPEQLVLAHYFLAMNFPDASIASFADVLNVANIDRVFLEKYDFILIPWFLYNKILPKSIDLITNFASFGEMRKKWLNYYTENGPFKTSKYFFTVNRFQSAPTYDTDLTLLDYPLNEFRTLHFAICPIFSHIYTRKFMFFYKRRPFSSQYFEFIGESR